jgi:3-oxoacyl-[acyl-carrier-protein] synthase II
VGLISPLGIGTDSCWNAVCSGRSGIGPITQFNAGRFAARIAGEVRDFDPIGWISKKDIKKTARFSQFAVVAAQMAVEHSGLRIGSHNADRVGVYIGSGIGGFEIIEQEHLNLLEKGPDRISPFLIPSVLVNVGGSSVDPTWREGTDLRCCNGVRYGTSRDWRCIQDH